jgi:hypothetical protein
LEFEIFEYLDTRESKSEDYLFTGYSTVKFHIRVQRLQNWDLAQSIDLCRIKPKAGCARNPEFLGEVESPLL